MPEPLPNPAERAQLAASLQHLPAWAQLSVEELEDMDEETFGHAIRYGTPEQAVAAMQRRLAVFRRHKAETLAVLEDDATPTDQRGKLEADLDALNQKLAAAERRLADHQLQHHLRN